MMKRVCMVLGVALALVGVIGFFMPHMLGMHLNLAHNLVHLVSGALAIYFATRTELLCKRFCQIFGVVYGLLGLIGFFTGPGTFTMEGMQGMTDGNLFKVIPGTLEFGTPDHVIHLILGVVLCAFGFMPRRMERDLEVRGEAARDRVTHR
jgi:hypothetical protein